MKNLLELALQELYGYRALCHKAGRYEKASYLTRLITEIQEVIRKKGEE